eukprot:CAMPEP_0184643858 /NCGR_PEP_ID=MMETSP0308-20130426/680_1 /TAXON_ID=38269 /ORGANISM="Gloeochaete witrockiana, Strain SAG 46.84" /LENGTH=212 /DNA_ID=CAMNT_0027072083 /DNA_START=436 /DNA_END=1074 /DNA_ORIENTATION=+
MLGQCIRRLRERILVGEFKRNWGSFIVGFFDSDEIFVCHKSTEALDTAYRVDCSREMAFPFIVPYGVAVQCENLCGSATGTFLGHHSKGPFPKAPFRISSSDTTIIKPGICCPQSTISAYPFDLLLALGKRPAYLPGFVKPPNNKSILCSFCFGSFEVSVGDLASKKIRLIYAVCPGADPVLGQDLLKQYFCNGDNVLDGSGSGKVVHIKHQ